MKCIGRTKTSNFRRRCDQYTGFLFCWQHVWQLPIALAALVTFAAALAQFSGFSARDLVGLGPPPPQASDIKVFFSGVYPYDKPKSDFELRTGERTLLFVRIPRIKGPGNRLVIGTAFVRPVNIGNRSMSGAQLVTIFADKHWHPGLGILDRESIISLSGPRDFEYKVEHGDGRWFAVRTIPRLDPFGGAPFPVSFLLQVQGITPNGELNKEIQSEMEIKMYGTDWVGLNHVIDIRCILADSAEEFLASSQALASSLRSKGYPDIHVQLAETGGETIVQGEGGEMIIQAKIDTLFTFKGGMLHDF